MKHEGNKYVNNNGHTHERHSTLENMLVGYDIVQYNKQPIRKLSSQTMMNSQLEPQIKENNYNMYT